MPPEDPADPSSTRGEDDLAGARQMLQTAKALGLAVLVLVGVGVLAIGPGELAEGVEVGGGTVRIGDTRDRHGHQQAVRFTGSGTRTGKLDSRSAGQKVAGTIVGGAFQGLGEQFLTMITLVVVFVGAFFGLKSL